MGMGTGKTTFLHQIRKYFLNASNVLNKQPYTTLINVQQLSFLNFEVVLNTLREEQPFLNQISIDQLKETLIQAKLKIILLFYQFEESLIKQNIQEIIQILKIFIDEFKFCIFLTLCSDLLEQIYFQDFDNQLIIQILPLENKQIEEYFIKTQVNYSEKINQILKSNNQNSIYQLDNSLKDQLNKILLDRSEIDIVSQWLKVFCNNISTNKASNINLVKSETQCLIFYLKDEQIQPQNISFGSKNAQCYNSNVEKDTLNFLRDKFKFNEAEKLIQASAEIDNFDQEAGNAMMVLSYISISQKPRLKIAP